MRRFLLQHPILRKSLWSMLFLGLFVMGKWIPLPYTDAKSALIDTPLNNIILIATGGNLAQLSLFTLGIQPWMAGMIIADLLGRSKRLKLSQKRLERIRKTIILLLAFMQGAVTVAYMKLTVINPMTKLMVLIVLIAGAMMVMWLAEMNGKLGLGGPMIMVLANIIQSSIGGVLTALIPLIKNTETMILFIIGALVALVLFTLLNVVMDRAEYRIPLTRILVDSKYTKKSYIPIKLTPAGGMPVMFAIGFAGIPIYLFQFLMVIFPKVRAFQWLSTNLQLTMLPGVWFYIIVLFILAIMFAYVNVDPEQQAENLRNSGDFIPGVLPGRDTENYIRKIVKHFAFIGAVYIVVISGVPLFWGVGNQQRMMLAMIPGYIFMIIGFAMMIEDQINTLRIKNKYRPLFEGER